MDPDLEFAVDALFFFRPGIQQWRLEQEGFLNAALETLTPLRKLHNLFVLSQPKLLPAPAMLRGLLFSSVVVIFNRYPALVTAILQLAPAYFDDNVLVDSAATSQQAKKMLQRTFSALDTPPKES